MSLLTSAADTGNGAMLAVMPTTIKILNKFEPMTLPMAMSLRPRKLDTSEATTSGKPVPIETMVRPITRSDQPQSRAKSDAP